MPINNEYILPSFPNGLNQTNLLAYLKEIRKEAERNNNQVCNLDHIEDLKYFVRFIYVESERIIEQIDMDNCSFFVALPPKLRGNDKKCLWIRDHKNQIHFATSKKGLIAPAAKDNFYSYFTYVIQEFKNGIKKVRVKQSGMSEAAHLWHSSPKTKEIIDEFIHIHQLNEKLENVISPNGLGNNVPFLMPEYEYLKNEILTFYVEKVENKELGFRLKQYIGKVH